jgi:hypothetical protein
MFNGSKLRSANAKKNSSALCRSEHSDAIAFAFESTQAGWLVAYLLAACAQSQGSAHYQQKGAISAVNRKKGPLR